MNHGKLIDDGVLITMQRIHRAYKALGFRDIDRSLGTTLLVYKDHPWPLLKLEAETGYSRKSIREAMRNFSMADICKQDRDGWQLTEDGDILLRWLFNEALEIGTELRRWWSAELTLELSRRAHPEANRTFDVRGVCKHPPI